MHEILPQDKVAEFLIETARLEGRRSIDGFGRNTGSG